MRGYYIHQQSRQLSYHQLGSIVFYSVAKMVIDMLLGLGLALPITTGVGVGVVTGVAEGVSYQQKMNEEMKSETRQLKFHIDIHIDSSHSRSASRSRRLEMDDSIVTMRDNKLWIEEKSPITRQPAKVGSHPFTGFYLNYPDEDRPMTRGLVSTISRDPPVLNWIYVDKDTYEIKCANRSGSIRHHVGDWDWTEEFGPESCLTFDGWEGAVAVEEADGKWALYFDKDDDGLKGKKNGRRTMEVSLKRRVITEQEVNKWGLGTEGNLGMKKTVSGNQIRGR